MNKRIAVGVGNTSVQFAQFDAEDLRATGTVPKPEWHHSLAVEEDLSAIAWPQSPRPNSHWFVASVNREAEARVRQWAGERWAPADYRSLDRNDFPIELEVEAPERVGRDRVAAAVAVNRVRPAGQAAIFVDAGTAITVNAISHEGKFLGGAILPGTLISSRALDAWTDQLPRIDVDWREQTTPPTPIGRSTEAAISSGIYWSAVGAVCELVSRFAKQLGDDLPVVITGGFGWHLANQIDNAQFIPHLVVAGIALAE